MLHYTPDGQLFGHFKERKFAKPHKKFAIVGSKFG